MTKFKDIIFEKDVAIHCPEEWMAEELLKYADSKGYEWWTGCKYTNHNCWRSYEQNTVYLIDDGSYSSINYAKENHKILHYNDVVIKQGEEMETKLIYSLKIKGRNAKIGDELWLKEDSGNFQKVTIGKISLFNFEYSRIRLITKKNKYTFFRTDDFGFIKTSLFWEKPNRFKGKQDWSQAPEKAVAWAIDENGQSWWFKDKPSTYRYYWSGGIIIGAGYRNDLINDREDMRVTDWKDSLVMRPNDV